MNPRERSPRGAKPKNTDEMKKATTRLGKTYGIYSQYAIYTTKICTIIQWAQKLPIASKPSKNNPRHNVEQPKN